MTTIFFNVSPDFNVTMSATVKLLVDIYYLFMRYCVRHVCTGVLLEGGDLLLKGTV